MKRIALLLMLTTIPVLAQSPLLKFELIDRSEAEPTSVKISLPMGLVEAFRPHMDEALSEVKLENHDIDFRAIWQEIRHAGPNQYVEIRSEDADVDAFTTASHLVVDVTDHHEGQTVRISTPLALGDAFFGGDHVDFDDVMDILLDMRGEDLLTISGDQLEGRAWIE